MTSFSERIGIRTEKIIQFSSIDNDTRTRLSNKITTWYLENEDDNRENIYPYENEKAFFEELWDSFLKESLDHLEQLSTYYSIRKYIRNKFFDLEWNRVYDFIEFMANNYPVDEEIREFFQSSCNEVLKQEKAGYRFIGGIVTPITSEEEISEVEEVLGLPDRFEPVRIHYETAIQKLSNREKPDYRNSIKESISAVQAACRIIAGGDKLTLGKALQKIERDGKVE